MNPWRTRDRQTVFSQPPWLVVEQHTVELPDGRVINNWPWVIAPDYVNVVVETESGTFLCMRQTKYAIEGTTLAVVGGYLNQGEDPLEAAKRELMEETGYVAEEWITLGHYRVDPNRGMAVGHLYLARQARAVGKIESDDLEEQEIIYLSRVELEAALNRGEFKILAWAAAVGFALQRLDSG